MQKRHWLAAALALVVAPVGCAALQGPQTERAERAQPRDDELAQRQAQREEARERARDGRPPTPRTPQEARRARAVDFISDVRCPMAMDGVEVVAIDAGAGGALEFRIRDRGEAQQVRDRVLGLMREAEEDAGRFDPLEADSVRYQRTDEGARLIFVTRGDEAILELRSQLQQRADMMRSQERCERGIVSLR